MEYIMLFKNLTGPNLEKKIQDMGIKCYPMYRTVFYSIFPKQDKEMKLKQQYKPHSNSPGMYTEYNKAKKADPDFVKRARDKLNKTDLFDMYYDNPDASLKLHISLNNIGEIDEHLILGLIQLLVQEAESSNNLNFHFKIVEPERHNDPRFKMNDQITIYFDKYTSAGDMIDLASTVDDYLKKHIKINEIALGPKDSFGFNSFVSSRFDNNKLLLQYGIFPFFDLELKKFFEKHNADELRSLPLCAFEAVFNMVIASKDIIIQRGAQNGLSMEDSKKVELEFEKMIQNPMQYMDASVSAEKTEAIQNKRVMWLISTISEITLDFELPDNLEDFKALLITKKIQLETIINEPWIQKDFSRLESQQLDKLMQEKEQEFNQTIDKYLAKLDGDLQKVVEKDLKRYKIIPPKLKQEAVLNFEQLLKQLKDKSIQLIDTGYLEKANVAGDLCIELDNAFSHYKKGYSDYETFKDKCNTAFEKALPVLEQHSGWKELLLNIWEAIKTLGVSLYNQHQRTEGKHWFFKVPTDSVNLVEQIKEPIKALEDEHTNASKAN